ATFLVAYPDHFLDLEKEYLPVADFARSCGPCDGLHNSIYHLVLDYDFELDLGQQIDAVFMSVICLRMALLPAVPTHFRSRHPIYANINQSLLDVVKLGGLNHRFDFSHHRLLFSPYAQRLWRTARQLFVLFTWLFIFVCLPFLKEHRQPGRPVGRLLFTFRGPSTDSVP